MYIYLCQELKIEQATEQTMREKEMTKQKQTLAEKVIQQTDE